MAELLGTGAAGAQLLQTAIVILRRIRKAYKQDKELAVLLEKHRRELERIRDLSEVVWNEKALKGAEVSEPLTRLHQLELKPCDWLARVDPGDKKPLRRFADQLFRGEGDLKKLDDIMRDLDRVKQDLTLIMNMHLARMSDIIHQAIATKRNRTKGVRNGNRARGAKVTAAQTQTIVNHGDTDDSDTSTEGSESDDSAYTIPQGPKVRRVKHNKAGRGSTMVNAPLGEKDLYADVQIVEIENNECEEGAQMYNYWNNESGLALAREERKAKTVELREQLLWEKDNQELRKAQITEMREQMLWEKKNGVGRYAEANSSTGASRKARSRQVAIL